MKLDWALAGTGAALLGAFLQISSPVQAAGADSSPHDRWRTQLTVVARADASCRGGGGSVRVQAPSRGFRIPPVDASVRTGEAYGAAFNHGTNVRLTASPAPDGRFVGWSGACSGDRPQCRVRMDRTRFVVAQFCG